MGPVAATVALTAGRATRRSWVAVVFGLVALWLALGPSFGLEAIASRVIPIWSGFRYPEKLVSFVSLALALLCAEGLARVTVRQLAIGAAVLVLLAGGSGLAASGAGAGSLPMALSELFRRGMFSAAMVGVASLVVWLARGRAWREPVLFVMCVAPAAIFNFDARPLLPASRVFEVPAAATAVRAQADRSEGAPRIFSPELGGRSRLPTGVSPSEALFVATRAKLVPDYNVLFGINGFDYYHAGVDAQYLKAASLPLDVVMAKIAPVYGAQFFVTGDPGLAVPASWRLVFEDPESSVRVLAVTPRLPRAYVARSLAVLGSASGFPDALLRPGFDAFQETLSECPVEGDDGVPRDRGTAELSSEVPTNVELNAHMREAGMLVLNDTYASGWHAEVDGQSAPICRVNGFVRGIKLGAGEHHVVFEYRPIGLQLGAALTVLTLGLLLLGVSRAARSAG